MDSTYRAIFEDITGEAVDEPKKKEASQIVEKGHAIDTKVIGKTITTGVAIAAIGSQIYAKQQATSNTITGNAIAQIHLNNQMAYFNEGLKLVGTLGVAAIVNPALIPLAAVSLGISYGMRAYDMYNQNQIKQASWQVESIINQDKQSRLVQNIVENRL